MMHTDTTRYTRGPLVGIWDLADIGGPVAETGDF